MINGKKTLKQFLLLIFLSLFSVPALWAHSDVRIGVLANRGQLECVQSWASTINYLNKQLSDYNFQLIPLSFNEIENSIQEKQIDLLICNPGIYLNLKDKYKLDLLASRQQVYQGQEYDQYGSLIFVKKENQKIQQLKDLKGKTIACVAPNSIGGNLLANDLMLKTGHDLIGDSKTLIYFLNQDEVVQAVMNSSAEVGIIRTGILEDLAATGSLSLDSIRVIHPQRYPNFPFLISTELVHEWSLLRLQHFPKEKALSIVEKLYAINVQHPKGSVYSKYSWTRAADYSFIQQILTNNRNSDSVFNSSFSGLKTQLSQNWYFFTLIFGLVLIFVLFVLSAQYLHSQFEKQRGKQEDENSLLKESDDEYSLFSNRKDFATRAALRQYELKNYFSWNYFKRFLGVSLIYYLSVHLSWVFSISDTGNTAIWFASGIGFFAVYVFGYRIWPAILFGALAINFSSLSLPLESYFNSINFYLVILYSLNNVFEAVFGVYLIRLFYRNRPFLSSIRSSTSFIIVVAFFSTFLSALIGSLLLFYIEGYSYFYSLILTWWLGDAAGLMLVVPLLLSWQSPKRSHSLLKQSLLLILFSILLAFVGFYVFQVGYHLAYLFIPFFIYFTFRFGRFLSLVMAFIISIISMGIVIYLNIYWLWNTPEEGIFYVRLFILILLLTILMVAAVLDEQHLAKERMMLYKRIVDNSTDGIALLDVDGHYLEQNKAHEKLLGYPIQELQNQSPAIHLGETVFQRHIEELRTEGVSNGEWISQTKSNSIPLEFSSYRLLNDLNEVICFVEFNRDISQRKKAESELQKREAEAWGLFEHAAIPIMIEDFSEIKDYIDKLVIAGLTDWEAYFDQNPEEIGKLAHKIKVLDANKRMLEFYGLDNKAELLNNFARYFTINSLDSFKDEIIELAQGADSFQCEIETIDTNGGKRNLLIRLSIPPLYRKNFQRVLVSFVDMTDIRRAEKIQQTLLNISNTANKADSLADTLEVVESNLKEILDSKNYFVALYDSEKDEFSLPFRNNKHGLPDKIAAPFTLSKLVIEAQKSLVFTKDEMEKMKENGILKPATKISKVWLGVPLKIKGNTIGVFAVLSYENENAYTEKDKEALEIIANQIALSIERKQADEEILFALEKAQESDRIKSAFLASMSHELRTPLNAIIGFSSFMDKDLPLDKFIQFGKLINKSGTKLLQIVESIFEVSLIDTGSATINNRLQSCSSLMEDIYQTIITRQKLINKGEVSIIMQHEQSLPEQIYVDDFKLKSIFLHLLNNALKFTKEGSIHFGFKTIDEQQNYHFYVKDTGIGIPKDKQAIIFDSFRMVDDTHNRYYEGMGIGLFICKKLILLLDGDIHVTSDENKGSYFSFYLPLSNKN